MGRQFNVFASMSRTALFPGGIFAEKSILLFLDHRICLIWTRESTEENPPDWLIVSKVFRPIGIKNIQMIRKNVEISAFHRGDFL